MSWTYIDFSKTEAQVRSSGSARLKVVVPGFKIVVVFCCYMSLRRLRQGIRRGVDTLV